jgi:SAM-dependent methyltransferase
MRVLSAGTDDAERFVHLGAAALDWIRGLIERHGPRFEEMRTILDFGCGAGRLLRHLRDHPARLGGVDSNPYLISWVSRNLPFVESRVTGREPYLDDPSEGWDLVLAIDVFTHLDEHLQRAWIGELERVTRPGGLIVLTTRGAGRAHELPPSLRATFDTGRVAVERPDLAGTNACAAYAPDAFVRAVLANRLELLEHEPDGAPDIFQDAVLLRRPGHGSVG